MISIRFIKNFSGIFANRVKNAKLFTSYVEMYFFIIQT